MTKLIRAIRKRWCRIWGHEPQTRAEQVFSWNPGGTGGNVTFLYSRHCSRCGARLAGPR